MTGGGSTMLSNAPYSSTPTRSSGISALACRSKSWLNEIRTSRSAMSAARIASTTPDTKAGSLSMVDFISSWTAQPSMLLHRASASARVAIFSSL